MNEHLDVEEIFCEKRNASTLIMIDIIDGNDLEKIRTLRQFTEKLLYLYYPLPNKDFYYFRLLQRLPRKKEKVLLGSFTILLD